MRLMLCERMDTMNLFDWNIEKALFRLRQSLGSLVSTRQTPHEKLATLRAELDERWQAEMLPVIEDLYWYPFRNGIAEAPEDEDELRTWLEEQYDDALIVAILLMLLMRYQREAYNLGGQIGLDFLGIDETFILTNEEIITELNEFAEMLVTQGTEFSLIDTTIDDLVRELPKARESESSALMALATYIAARAVQRNEMIERSERPRQVANALHQLYRRNGVQFMMYDVMGVGCPRICAPWHGQVFRMGTASVRIPQHPHCDCGWSPILFDGQVVGSPPVVVSVPELPSVWEIPEDVWRGS